MGNVKNIEHLLKQVTTINKSYKRINQAIGGNFNIFSVLKIERDEVTTHSRFISELLNPNGVHGFKGKFLELFIESLSIETELNPNNCEVIVERYLGAKTDTSGGNIDILIKERDSKVNVIMIENKIDADEQINQLQRYYNAYPKGKLLYLTLMGDESKQHSSFNNYERISYEKDILVWLEACKRESVNNPILRETLTQYINLIKKITHQNINMEMNREIAQLFINNEENFDSLISISNLKKEIKNIVFEDKIIPDFKELKKEIDGFDFGKNISKINERYYELCRVENEQLKQKNLCIIFEFQQKNSNYLIGGFCYINKELNKELNTEYNYEELKKRFRETFKEFCTRETPNFLMIFDYKDFMNLDSNIEHLKNLIYGNFKKNIKNKITSMLEMVDNSF